MHARKWDCGSSFNQNTNYKSRGFLYWETNQAITSLIRTWCPAVKYTKILEVVNQLLGDHHDYLRKDTKSRNYVLHWIECFIGTKVSALVTAKKTWYRHHQQRPNTGGDTDANLPNTSTYQRMHCSWRRKREMRETRWMWGGRRTTQQKRKHKRRSERRSVMEENRQTLARKPSDVL